MILHCLNLKLTYKCTNRCPFCFSKHLSNNEITLDGLKKAIEIGFSSGCREIVLSGGEPTIVPEILTSVLTFAESLGYEKYILQTNGSGLLSNSKLFDSINAIAEKKDFYVSFSVHAHTAGLHDFISKSQGAFNKLIAAIRETMLSNCKIYTNTVVSKYNILYLKHITELLLPFEPLIMQFSMMHLESVSDFSTSLIETSTAIKHLKKIVPLEVLKTEGIPFCLMYGMESCVGESFWPDKLDLYNYEDNYMSNFTQLGSNMRVKRAFCRDCIMNEICMGVWRENFDEFENLNLHPIN